MNSMLAFDPINRPSIPEILSHNWTKGPTASSEEVFMYFSNFKLKMDQHFEKERIEKDKVKLMKKQAKENMKALGSGEIMFNKRGNRGEDEEVLMTRAQVLGKLEDLDFAKVKFNKTDNNNLSHNTLLSG